MNLSFYLPSQWVDVLPSREPVVQCQCSDSTCNVGVRVSEVYRDVLRRVRDVVKDLRATSPVTLDVYSCVGAPPANPYDRMRLEEGVCRVGPSPSSSVVNEVPVPGILDQSGLRMDGRDTGSCHRESEDFHRTNLFVICQWGSTQGGGRLPQNTGLSFKET